MSHLVVAGGGPEASDEELLAIVERFKDMARNLAGEVGYAFVSVEPKFSAFVASTQPTGCGERSGDLELLCDEVVFDAFPYQILGPGHLRRLGAMPEGAERLPGGRFELSLGEPAQWLIDFSIPQAHHSPWIKLGERRMDPTVQDRAREILAPCLVHEGYSVGLRNQRWERVQRRSLGLEEYEEPPPSST